MHFYNKVSCADISPTARTVYRALLQYANRETWSCYPSVRTLMKDTGLCERTIRNQLKILSDRGLILKIPRTRENNGCSSNMYFFN